MSFQTIRRAIPPFSTFIVVVAVMLCPWATAEDRDGQTKQSTRDQVSILLQKLDSGNFSDRESASNELAKLGQEAIEPLALHSFECSPETVWRIKKTLEAICTNGDRDVFFKALGILQLRFDSGDANSKMGKRLAQLKEEWKLRRKEDAIKKLENKGAIVTDPWKDSGLHGMAMGLPGGMVFGDTAVVSIEGVSFKLVNGELVPIVEQVAEKRIKRELISKQAQREKIKTILESSVEENEELVFGLKNKKKAKANGPESDKDRFEEALRMGMRRTGRVSGITVEIPRNWKGSSQDLSDLNAISKVSDLTLVGQKVDEKTFENLTTLTALNSLTIKDCNFKLDDFSESDWDMAIQEITISDQEINSQLIESFSTITSLQSLTLDRCNLEPESLLAIDKLKSLRGLSLTRMELGEDVFNALAKQNRLAYANLARCRFESKLYQGLVAKRPRLQVDFSGQALLGVHGSADLGMGSTNFRGAVGSAITQVVPDSAADKSGMKVGDIINRVDERAITSFEDLRLCIAAHKSGDRLAFRVKRGDKVVDLNVVLAAADGMDD